MSKIYLYTSKGYYAGESEYYEVMPNNSTKLAPTLKEGFIPRWVDGKWKQIENHKGKQGYVNGEPYTIKDYGPYPESWSAEPPQPTPEEQQTAIQAQFTAAIQNHLDRFAHTRNYDGILSAATYATSTVSKFADEGQYAVEARDATWAKGYEILDAVLSGQRPMPTIEEVIAELPQLAWPEVAV